MGPTSNNDIQAYYIQIIVDERLPVPAATHPDVVLVRPDATADQKLRAIAAWLRLHTGTPVQ